VGASPLVATSPATGPVTVVAEARVGARYRAELAEAALRPAVHAGRASMVLLLALGMVALAGVAAYLYQLTAGLGVTALDDTVFWGLYESTLVTFIGFSYGGALVSAILRLTGSPWRGGISRIAEVTALATLLVGALFPIIHVGRPERLWQMLVHPQIDSPIVWDLVAISTYLLATIVLLGLPLVADMGILRDDPSLGSWRRRLYGWLSFGWRGTDGQRRALSRGLTIVAILVVPLAVTVHTVLSYAFSLTSRPGWHSTIFGPYFVIGAIYSGVAVVILAAVAYRRAYGLARWIDDRAIRNLGFVLVALAMGYGYVTFTELTTEGYVSETADAAVLFAVLLDRYAPLFWSFVVFGLVVPVVLVAVPRTRTPAGLALASALVIGTMYLKRFLITVPPQTVPMVEGQAEAARASYVPNVVEIAVVLGAGAAIAIIVMVLFRVFPVLSVHEIEEIEEERLSRLQGADGTPAAAVEAGKP
jgi:Ni/Fe-hydrogenase subunit HybB-like protein